MRYAIVSRHPAAVRFIKAAAGCGDIPGQFETAEVLSGNVTAEDISGKIVAGNLPLALAALAHEVWAIEFTGDPPRGAEYGLEEMVAAGGHMSRYQVKVLPTRKPCSTLGCCSTILPSEDKCLECMEK